MEAAGCGGRELGSLCSPLAVSLYLFLSLPYLWFLVLDPSWWRGVSVCVCVCVCLYACEGLGVRVGLVVGLGLGLGGPQFKFLLCTPLQYSCLENPRDRGAWWAAIYGVAQSRT